MTTASPWGGRTPRAWQPAALAAVRDAWRAGRTAPLVHACTGAGKSVFLAEVAAQGKGRVLITTPTQALVAQLFETVSARLPGEVGMCYQHAWDSAERVVITCNASLDALLDEGHSFGCWIADEAHRIEGDGLRAASSKIVRKVALGLTATPFRGDSKGLATWDAMAFSYPSGQAVRDGVLVPWRPVWRDAAQTDDTDTLSVEWIRSAVGPGIVSAVDIADAEGFAARLVADGIPAMAIHGSMSTAERTARIERLRSGAIRCLVHVQLLTEGIDLPWLAWLCLRRKVASPVRLVQEVGRVLRAAPAKTEAVLYDPHGVLIDLGLVHGASLEDAQKNGNGAGGELWSIEEIEGLDAISQIPKAQAVAAVSGWVALACNALRDHGIVPPPDPKYAGGKWREKRVTEKQRASLVRMQWATRYLPTEQQRYAACWLLEQPKLRSGIASDLGGILRGLANAARSARQGGPRYVLPCSLPEITAEAVQTSVLA